MYVPVVELKTKQEKAEDIINQFEKNQIQLESILDEISEDEF